MIPKEIEILVVDDEEMVRSFLVDILAREGYRCRPVENADEACRVLEAGRVDLALLDVNLPGRSGVQLLRELKTISPDTAALMVTAAESLETATHCLKQGADDYILKPFSIEFLLQSIRTSLHRRELTLRERERRDDLERRVRDQTNEIRAVHNMLVQQEKLATMGQLAAGIAHEINNPTGFISSNLRTLEKYVDRIVTYLRAQEEALEGLPEEKKKILEELRRRSKLDYILADLRDLVTESLDGAGRVQKIVQGLKNFARIENAPRSADLNECIESALGIVWNEIKYKATVQRNLGPVPPTWCFSQQLNQVFTNILVNAAHAIEEKGEIRIASRAEGDEIAIEIADNGCGIPEEHVERIFDPFFTTKEEGKGTGLGMGIARDIVRKHGGSIGVKSTPGKGTVFTIRIPVRTEEWSPEAESESPAAGRTAANMVRSHLESEKFSSGNAPAPSLDLLLESIPEPIFYKRKDGKYLGCNSAFSALFGLPREEIAGREDRELAGKVEVTRSALKFDGLSPIGIWQAEEVLVRRPDGTTRWLKVFESEFRDEAGETAGVVGTGIDITERKEAEEALFHSEEKYRFLFESMAQGVVYQTGDGEIVDANPAAERILGLPLGEMRGRTSVDPRWQTIHADGSSLPGEEHPAMVAIRTGEPVSKIFMGVFNPRENGHRWINVSAVPLFRPGEERPYQVYTSFEDMTDLKNALDRLQETTDTFQGIVEASPAAIVAVTPEGKVLSWNRAAERIFGWSREEVVGRTLPIIRQGEWRDFLDFLRQAMNGEMQPEMHRQRVRKDGTVVDVSVSNAPLRDAKGNVYGIIGLLTDITDRLRAEAQVREKDARLKYLAYHDCLTHLPNRVLLLDRCQHALAAARRSGGQVALLFLDLDLFKKINDSLGHQIGDRVLCEVARRLRTLFRESDTVARLGGDEFVIVLENIHDDLHVGMIAQKILAALSKPIIVDAYRLYVSGSIGVGLFPGDGQDFEGLLKAAEVAMYRAKEGGRNGYQIFRADMNARAQETLLLETRLREAMEKGELAVHYQPQVELASGRTIGFEALLRWNHPERGMVSPGEFIPLAEETGLIVPIGEWVLKAACRQARIWQERGHPPLRMAVNVSARQFRQSGLVRMVKEALRATSLDPALLELEITESTIMHDIEATVVTMHELNALGVQLCIDDFGTGYSSLSYLKRFPIRKLKIDRSFVRDVITDPNDAAIAAAVIALAHTMNLEVVAEGIENTEQMRFLLEKGCDQGQGFLFSPARPDEEIG